jgi:hypothetical protein
MFRRSLLTAVIGFCAMAACADPAPSSDEEEAPPPFLEVQAPPAPLMAEPQESMRIQLREWNDGCVRIRLPSIVVPYAPEYEPEYHTAAYTFAMRDEQPPTLMIRIAVSEPIPGTEKLTPAKLAEWRAKRRQDKVDRRIADANGDVETTYVTWRDYRLTKVAFREKNYGAPTGRIIYVGDIGNAELIFSTFFDPRFARTLAPLIEQSLTSFYGADCMLAKLRSAPASSSP